jgi:endonuclease YncB( thermonuclease family)
MKPSAMKTVLFFICGFLSAGLPVADAAAVAKISKNTLGRPIEAFVDYVYDGDTFSAYVALENGIKISVRVRIMQIDAPEMNGACAREIEMAVASKMRLGNLLPQGKRVMLHNVKDDKYLGRIDAHVLDLDGRDIGDILLKEGLARKYNGGRRQPWCQN